MPSRLQNGQDKIHDALIRRIPKLIGPLVILFMLTSLVMTFPVTFSAVSHPSAYFFGFSGSSSGTLSVVTKAVSVQIGLWGYCLSGKCTSGMDWSFSKTMYVLSVSVLLISQLTAIKYPPTRPISSTIADRFQIFILCLLIFHLIRTYLYQTLQFPGGK